MGDLNEEVASYRRLVADSRMGVPVASRQAWRTARRACEQAIHEARMALRYVDELRGHACTWNDDDRCSICGADGRA